MIHVLKSWDPYPNLYDAPSIKPTRSVHVISMTVTVESNGVDSLMNEQVTSSGSVKLCF